MSEENASGQSPRDRIVRELFDNWELRNKAEADRDRLIMRAVDIGVPMEDITLATGLKRTTLWRIRKRMAMPTTPSRAWNLIGADGGVRENIVEGGLQDALEDMLDARFDALGIQPEDDPDAPTASWWDEEHMTARQKELAVDVKRLALRAQTAGDETKRIDDDATGVSMTRASDMI
jgi:hypothetical protein